MRLWLVGILVAVLASCSCDSTKRNDRDGQSPKSRERPIVLKEGAEFTQEELSVLAAAFDQIVLGERLLNRPDRRELLVTLGTADRTREEIIPIDEFLKMIVSEGRVIRAPIEGEYRYEPWLTNCRLRLFGWRGPDTARVDVEVGNIEQGANVVRDGDHWKVYPDPYVLNSNYVLPPRPNQRMQPVRGASSPSDRAR